ncbi:MAG: hypothetical protein MK077_03270 [Phycisphaerales bacterium]|nr:hypothetical protein [Phycisphaerales bacterium]
MGFDDLVILGGVMLYVVGAVAGALKKGKAKTNTPKAKNSTKAPQAKTIRTGGRREPGTGLRRKFKEESPAAPPKLPPVANPAVVRRISNDEDLVTVPTESPNPGWSQWQQAIVLSEVLGRPRGDVDHEPVA